jgi:hypothetical protein
MIIDLSLEFIRIIVKAEVRTGFGRFHSSWRGDKRGFISNKTAKTINDIGIDPNSWLDELKGFKSIGFSAVGTAEQLKDFSVKTKRHWTLGIKLTPALE